ncbi:hypothetical protein PGT21_013373 [Puccinia graminis f. sp. tritici]|uniref:Uncharacterized protein n=1 Tax=Puccinia graminis f. sp. tritici TaxID=56615 RepID=A0A5B0QW30_PUCGR|nr:hypothetical protein PGT21_013373 [Puccinia graminis f. sp. tritici]
MGPDLLTAFHTCFNSFLSDSCRNLNPPSQIQTQLAPSYGYDTFQQRLFSNNVFPQHNTFSRTCPALRISAAGDGTSIIPLADLRSYLYSTSESSSTLSPAACPNQRSQVALSI